MRTSFLRASSAYALALTLQACNCGGDVGVNDAGALSPDSGLIAVDAGPSGDAGSVVDAGNVVDAGTAVDAGTPVDAGAHFDAGIDDRLRHTLYAHLGGTLQVVDLTTGQLTPVGATGQTWLAIAWDDSAQVARAVTGNYSPLGGPTTPMLGTIDLCTGAIDAGVNISVDGGQVRRSEAIARNPDGGTFFVSFGRLGTAASTEFISESTGTIEVATGAVTVLGSHNTVQDDGDALMFVGDTLYMMDVATGSNSGFIYRIDQATGQATQYLSTGPKVVRIAHDPSRNVTYAAYTETNGTARGIAILDLSTGVMTKLGTDVPNSVYPGVTFSGLFTAPPQLCP